MLFPIDFCCFFCYNIDIHTIELTFTLQLQEFYMGITQQQLADLAGVSRSTVSLVIGNSRKPIHPETRRRVLELAEKYHYQVNPLARQLRSGESSFVNIVTVRHSGYHVYNTIGELENILSEKGFHTMLSHIDPNSPEVEKTIQSMMAFRFAGTLLLDNFGSNDDKDPSKLSKVFSRYPNVVFFNQANRAGITIDYEIGITEAFCELHKRGRKRIFMALNDAINQAQKQRKDGFLRGMHLCGLEENANHIWIAEDHNLQQVAVSPMQERMQRRWELLYKTLICEEKADAILLSNDEWAVHFMHYLQHQKVSIPDDVAIIGNDNVELLCNASNPTLSSIGYDNLAESFVKCLESMINDPEPINVTIPTKLFIRDSI